MSILTETSYYSNLPRAKQNSLRARFHQLSKKYGPNEALAMLLPNVASGKSLGNKGYEPTEEEVKSELERWKQTGVATVLPDVVPMGSTAVELPFTKDLVKLAPMVFLSACLTGYLIYASHGAYGEGVEGWFIASIIEVLIVFLSIFHYRKWWKNLLPKALLVGLVVVTFQALSQGVSGKSKALGAMEQQRELLLEDRVSLPANWVTKKQAMTAKIESLDSKIQAETMRITSGLGEGKAGVALKVRWVFLIANVFLGHLIFTQLFRWQKSFKEF